MNILKHRGYYAVCDIDFATNQLYARLCYANIWDTPVRADTPEELKNAFESRVDEYLGKCAKKKWEPIPPFTKNSLLYSESELAAMLPPPWISSDMKAEIVSIRKYSGEKTRDFEKRGDGVINIPAELAFHLMEFVTHRVKVREYLELTKRGNAFVEQLLLDQEATQKHPIGKYYRDMRDFYWEMLVESARKAEEYSTFWSDMLRAYHAQNDIELPQEVRFLSRSRLLEDLPRRRMFIEDAYIVFGQLKEFWLDPGKFDDDDRPEDEGISQMELQKEPEMEAVPDIPQIKKKKERDLGDRDFEMEFSM